MFLFLLSFFEPQPALPRGLCYKLRNNSFTLIAVVQVTYDVPFQEAALRWAELTCAERSLELGMSGRVKRTGHLAKFPDVYDRDR